jgi:hypothetical protein
MKPLKDLAELNHPRVDPKILLQFNTLIENVRIYASNHAPSWGTHEILKCFEFMDKLELITPEPEANDPTDAISYVMMRTGMSREQLEKKYPVQLDPREGNSARISGDEALTPEEKDAIHKFIDFSNGAHGMDGSGDCEETKEAFSPKKWLGKT